MRLDAFTQLHVSRKSAPLFVGMAQEKPTVDLLSDMPQADLDAVLKAIMPFVRRKDAGAWAKIYNADAQVFAYEDIGGADILEIMFNVIMEYIPDFFLGIDHLQSGTPQPAESMPA